MYKFLQRLSQLISELAAHKKSPNALVAAAVVNHLAGTWPHRRVIWNGGGAKDAMICSAAPTGWGGSGLIRRQRSFWNGARSS